MSDKNPDEEVMVAYAGAWLALIAFVVLCALAVKWGWM